MFEFISGQIAFCNPAYIVLETGGIGYHIKISVYTYEKIAGTNTCKLLIHQVIKEDAHLLYGFFDEEERTMFRHLINISGIGSGTAILILSSLKTSEIRHAILSGNLSLLKSIKGVGPKTAQRLIIELQDVFKKSSNEGLIQTVVNDSRWNEAVSALTMLGFKKADAESVVSGILKSNPERLTTEEIIKLSLKQI